MNVMSDSTWIGQFSVGVNVPLRSLRDLLFKNSGLRTQNCELWYPAEALGIATDLHKTVKKIT